MRSSYDRLFIDGRWRESTGNRRMEVVSPFTEESVGSVPAGTMEDIDRAVAAARSSVDSGSWSRRDPAERAAVLSRVLAAVDRDREGLAELITLEMGCPITQARGVQVGSAMGLLEGFLAAFRDLDTLELRTDGGGRTGVVSKVPVGVVAAIIPWNTPLTSVVIKVAPALLAGCSVVLKLAPETPLTGLALAGLFEEAGLPEGVLSVIPAERDVSEHLVAHPGVDKVAFTGSTSAGRRIAAVAAPQFKRLSLELGGKSAAIVLDDADLGATVEALRLGSFRNSGQICSLKTRVLVHRSLKDEFEDRLRDLVGSMPVGDPMDPQTQVGPMATARQRDIVRSYIDGGLRQGARRLVGDPGVTPTTGWFVEPTVFTEVTPEMTIFREEIFGPVLSVLSFEDEDQAVRLANDSPFGLNGAVFTSDPDRGLAVASRIRTGTVEVNGHPAGFLAPVGGFKDSGLGRESGRDGLEAYLESRSYGVPASWAAENGARLSGLAHGQ